MISLQDENRDKATEEELEGKNPANPNEVPFPSLLWLAVQGMMLRWRREGRVCADMLLTVDLVESQALSLGFPGPSSCVFQFPCTSVTTLRVPFSISEVTDGSRE